MSKALRLLGAVAVAAATVPFAGVGPAAAAESTTITASTGGYFYAGAIRKPDDSPAPPPNLTSDHADGVGKGNLAVAAEAGQEDKVSFLLFDLLDVAPDAVVSKAILTLPLVEDDADNRSYAAEPIKVRACGAGDEGFNGDDGTSIQDAPARKCDVFAAPAKASTDGKSYVIDITKLAQSWLANNDGVALTAAEGAATTPFQVVFGPAEKATLALAYSGSDVTDVVPPVVQAPVTGSTGSSDLGGGFSGGVAPAPSVDSGLAPVVEPALPAAPAPAVGVAPVAAAPQAPPQPVALETTLTPTTAFWLGGIVLAAVLVLLSLIMGDPNVPQASARQSRLAKALADRQRGAATGRSTLGRPATV